MDALERLRARAARRARLRALATGPTAAPAAVAPPAPPPSAPNPPAPATAKRRWVYGLRNRPATLGSVPEGRIIGADRPHPRFRHGTIEYPFPLTEDQLDAYELVLVPEGPGSRFVVGEEAWESLPDGVLEALRLASEAAGVTWVPRGDQYVSSDVHGPGRAAMSEALRGLPFAEVDVDSGKTIREHAPTAAPAAEPKDAAERMPPDLADRPRSAQHRAAIESHEIGGGGSGVARKELSPRERGLFLQLQTTGAASVDGGPSARIVPHPSVAGRAVNDQPHFTVEVTWQGKRSYPFAAEPPMTIAEAQLAAGGVLLDPARWPGKRVKKINRLRAADLVEKALKKAGYTEIRRSFDPHAPAFTSVVIHAKDPAYRSERDPVRGHGTISIGAHDGLVALDKTFALFTDSTLRTRDVIDAALAGFEIDVLLDPPPVPKTELDPFDAYAEIYRAIEESRLDASDPARLYIGDLTEYRAPHAPRKLLLMRRDHARSRQEGRTILYPHPIGRIFVHGDDGRIVVEVDDEKDRPLVQQYVDAAIQGRRVVPEKQGAGA